MLHVIMSVVVGWWFFPHFCQLVDQQVVKKRLRSSPAPSQSISPRVAPSQQIPSETEFLDSLAMAIRSGVGAGQALDSLAAQKKIPMEFIHVLHHQPARPLQLTLTALQENAKSSEWSLVASLLLQSYRNGTLDVSALDIAAQTIRNNQQRANRVLASTAQARLTTRVLTVIPVTTLLLGAVLSSNVRTSLHEFAIVLLLMLGLLLNGAGYVWMRSITRSVHHATRPHAVQELLTSLTISIHAGDSLIAALERWENVNATGQRVATRLRAGQTLPHVLLPLEEDCGNTGAVVRRLLIENHHTGGSVTDLVTRLRNDVDADVFRHAEILIQQMSTKLTLPLVFCILPAFLFLALMPVAMASINTLPSSSVL